LQNIAQTVASVYFKVPKDLIPECRDIFVKLYNNITRLRGDLDLRRNPSVFTNRLNDVRDSLVYLMKKARTNKSVIENLVLGVDLQLLKVELVSIIESFLKVFDQYSEHEDLGVILSDLKHLNSNVSQILNDFYEYRNKYIESSKGVIFLEEANADLTRCFDKVISFLERIEDQLNLFFQYSTQESPHADAAVPIVKEFMVWLFVGMERIYTRFL
jgi:hypothetical protein